MSKKFYKVLFVIVIISMFLFALTSNVFAAKEVTQAQLATELLEYTNLKKFKDVMGYEVSINVGSGDTLNVELEQGAIEHTTALLILDTTSASMPYSGEYNYKTSMQYSVMQDVAEYVIKNGTKAVPEAKEELDALIDSLIKTIKSDSGTVLYIDATGYGLTFKKESTTTNETADAIRTAVRSEISAANSYSKDLSGTAASPSPTTKTTPQNTVVKEKIPAAGIDMGLVKVCSAIIAISVLGIVVYAIYNKAKK